MEKNKLIELNNISKTFGPNQVLKNINLYIRDNEFITLLGPSGCGKTTLLRIIAGFEKQDSGEILFLGKDITSYKANERKINTVFQNYALFPHLTVFGNIAFGLKNQKLSKIDIEKKVLEALKTVKLEGFENRKIETLSGGQKQRVAIARAIVLKPKVLLLDEPLAALDLKLRQDMQYELKEMQRQLGITFIFVTHDQEEALSMSDTIVIINKGEIQQIGTPEDVYNEPKNKFVANFIGETNIIEGVYQGKKVVRFFNKEFSCVDENFSEGELCYVVIRPEDWDLVAVDTAKITGIITSSIFLGVHYELCFTIDGREYVIHTLENKKVGEEIGLSIDPYEIHLMKIENEL